MADEDDPIVRVPLRYSELSLIRSHMDDAVKHIDASRAASAGRAMYRGQMGVQELIDRFYAEQDGLQKADANG